VGGAHEGDGEECVRGNTCEEIETGPKGSRGSRHHESSAFTAHHGTLTKVDVYWVPLSMTLAHSDACVALDCTVRLRKRL
jgi:hypothetical protein